MSEWVSEWVTECMHECVNAWMRSTSQTQVNAKVHWFPSFKRSSYSYVCKGFHTNNSLGGWSMIPALSNSPSSSIVYPSLKISSLYIYIYHISYIYIYRIYIYMSYIYIYVIYIYIICHIYIYMIWYIYIYLYIICNMCNIGTFAIIGYKSYATQQQLGSCTNEAHRLRDVDGSQRDAAVKGSRQEARDRGRQRHSQQRGTAGKGPATDDQNGVGDVHLGTWWMEETEI